jgi:uncharacterized membrane protein YqjE
MNHTNHTYDERKPIGELLQSLKQELSEFISTRVQIAIAEMKEKTAAWKAAVPLLGAALLFAVMSLVCLTLAFISLIAESLSSDYAWAIASAIVFVVYLIIAGIAGWLGYSELKDESIVPERTLRVLKADQNWIKNETRAA